MSHLFRGTGPASLEAQTHIPRSPKIEHRTHGATRRALDIADRPHYRRQRRHLPGTTDYWRLPRAARRQHLEHAGRYAAGARQLGVDGCHDRCEPLDSTPTSAPASGTAARSAFPFITVPGTQTKYPATFLYDDESDAGPYAVPLNAPIEGGSSSTGDRHAIAVDTGNCILYELYRAFPQASSWTADSGAIFDLRSNALRPLTWTSADAAGLPIMPGLVTYEEVLSGEIRHAIRFTVPQTRREFVWPARHYASSLDRHAVSADGRAVPAEGQRSTSRDSRPTCRSFFAR